MGVGLGIALGCPQVFGRRGNRVRRYRWKLWGWVLDLDLVFQAGGFLECA